MRGSHVPAIWFPAVRTGSGTDVFTQQLVSGIRNLGLRADITWLPHRVEYAPWTIRRLSAPPWANLIHVNTWLPARVLPKTLPIIATIHLCVHDPLLEPFKTPAQSLYHRAWIKRLEREILERAARTVAVSAYSAEMAASTLGVGKPTIITNGVDLEFFRPSRLHQPHKPFRLLYVGNWSARKGFDLLGPIAKALGPGFELWYTTDRSPRRTAPTEFPSNTHNIGRLSPAQLVTDAYQACDALLFPSRMEGLPLAALEAQACGLPVIGANTSSIPEVVEDGVTGILCPPDSPASFVDAARMMSSSPEVLEQMRHNSRARAERLFDLKRMVQSYVALYHEVLNESAGRSIAAHANGTPNRTRTKQ